MAKAYLTLPRELRYSNVPAAFFGSFECHLNARINCNVRQSRNQKFFQDVNPLVNRLCPGKAFLQTRTIFGQQCGEWSTALDKRVDRYSEKQKSNARFELYTEQCLSGRGRYFGRCLSPTRQETLQGCALPGLDGQSCASVWQCSHSRGNGTLNGPKAAQVSTQ